MNRKNFGVILLVILVYSCNQKLEKTRYFENGSVKERYLFQNKEDIKTNSNYDRLRYFENGNLKDFVTIRNGVEVGEYYEYYENGVIQSITPYKEGRKHGVEWLYTKKKELAEENFYLNDSILITMKSYWEKGNSINFYYYADGDTLEEIGILVFDNKNALKKEDSFYYYIDGSDSINLNDTYSLKIETYTFGKPSVIDSVLIGEFNENYEFISKQEVTKLEGSSNEVVYSFLPTKTGYNLIMGKIYMSNLDINEPLNREFIFYKSFFVK
jgi:hypothetical protein